MSQIPSLTPRSVEFIEAASARGEGSQARLACAAVGLKGILLRARTAPLGDLHPIAANFFAIILAEYSRTLPIKELPRLLSMLDTAESLFLADFADAATKADKS